jgi:phosphatidylglycerol:prolipoprotein diacylglycerol transferase
MIWNVDPEIARIGPFAIRWYSLFFALGFLVGYFIIRAIFRKEQRDVALLDSLLVYLILGTIIGARLGQVLFYEPGEYLRHPLEIIKTWHGGLASHGGFAGVLIALMLFCRRKRLPFLWLADRLTIPIMLAAASIRIGNFFNSEIVGRPTHVPWAVVFTAVDTLPRHPTQIYESLGYAAISLVLYLYYRASARQPSDGVLLGSAMILGFGWRVIIEFLKERQEPFEAGLPLDMGQLLSIPFLMIGLYLVFRRTYASVSR